MKKYIDTFCVVVGGTTWEIEMVSFIAKHGTELREIISVILVILLNTLYINDSSVVGLS